MDGDFGAFMVLGSSPPGIRLLSNLTQHMHKPHAPSRSASTLSPVVEGNEETDGKASTGGCLDDAAEPVQVISTSIPPSRTFLELTRGGFFSPPRTDLEEVSGSSEPGGQPRERDASLALAPLIGNDGGVTAGSIGKNGLNNNGYVKNAPGKNAPSKPAVADETRGAGGSDARSPLARPKMQNNSTLNSPAGLRSAGGTGADAKLLPAVSQSVEQAVHRDRVNSLLRPSNHKPALGKINPKSVPPANRAATLKASPPISEPSKSGVRSPRSRKVGSAHARPNGKIGPVSAAASPNKTYPPRVSPPAKNAGGANGLPPKQQDPGVGQPRRRKSLPDINTPQSPANSLDSVPTSPPTLGSPPQPARKMPPRRKISEPCFPTQGSLMMSGVLYDPRHSPSSVPSSPSAAGDAPKSPGKKAPPRRKISEPCFPTYGSPTLSASPQSMRGIFADPRYNPVLLTSRTTSCPDLLKKQGAESRKHPALHSLSALSKREAEPRAAPPNFTEEYEKIKNCRYLRKSNEGGADDV